MKTIKMSILTATMIIAIVAVSLSCKKENLFPKYRSALDNALAERVYGAVFAQSDDAARNHASKSGSTCPVYTVTGLPFPITVTMDFGTACLGTDGITYSGKIISVIDKPYIDSTSQVISRCDNLHMILGLEDYTVEGRQIITNIGHNNLGHHIFTVVVDSASISFNEGGVVKTITWRCNRQNEWIAGDDTWLNIFDDVYLVTGTSNGTDINGDPFELNITRPLRIAFDCRYISEGTLEIVNPGYPTIVVDYGNGNCDNTYTVTVSGMNFNLVM